MTRSIEEHNRERRKAYSDEPPKTGVACPECGTELVDAGGGQLLSKPPQKHVICPKCSFTTTIVC
jgi:hypothetical protein